MTITIEPLIIDGPHRHRIVRTLPLGSAKGAYRCLLDCGHEGNVYGRAVVHQGTVVLCSRCQDEAEADAA